MQLCVNIQLMPTHFANTGPRVVYIDTEGNFVTKRVIEIAKKTIEFNQDFDLKFSSGMILFYSLIAKHCLFVLKYFS
jgi:RecA/RadA recombinase